MKKLLVVLVLLVAVGYAGSQGYGWYQSQINDPVGGDTRPVAVHIDSGETPDAIAADLVAKGLVRNREVFLVYLRSRGNGANIQAGDFQLSRSMSMAAIVDHLTSGTNTLQIRLAEGLTLAKMAEAVQVSGLASGQQYTAAAQLAGHQESFLLGRPQGAPPTLEGFLFPDTYQLPPSAGARGLVQLQLDRFGRIVGAGLSHEIQAPAAGRPLLSLYQLVSAASIVEREVNRDPDRRIVCGIIFNRLQQGMPLQIDATVLYGLGRFGGQLTQADLGQDTPYNTYLHQGLPPGPIANPGEAALKACVEPQPSTYLFYFSDPSGATHYATTGDEFERLKRQFGVAGG
ncbi:MAG: endolytic transglycosylase MltG [Candidatus Dormibacteraeota bacterium]|uniref:Endolytic murein transglycosylase n=1 Tax=Candidatus Dormiibacter inghamiae TaxID=3127013 RepID=A0A934NE40_9BACT|nr:endolytic transglycosylase MltG [Candidatus Dormibacteraeota bacterium]MBJ7607489.1 endolytic transglycosylase MltG [Candidatus Dormibacteraeota bacterium]